MSSHHQEKLATVCGDGVSGRWRPFHIMSSLLFHTQSQPVLDAETWEGRSNAEGAGKVNAATKPEG